MYNYYEILNVNITSDNNNIKTNYKNIINKYYNKYNLSFDEIKYIKIIKTGLYILTNNYLKNKYNILLFNSIKENNNNENITINNNVSIASNDHNIDDNKNNYNIEEVKNNINHNNNITNNENNENNINKNNNIEGVLNNNYDNNNLNDMFNIDNSWMKDIKTNDDDKKLDNNLINDRIFTLHNSNKIANSEINNNIRTPLSCRENKKN